jgi:hypothetical protein
MASAVIVYLRKLLRFVNYVILFSGLAMIILAAEFYITWNRERDVEKEDHSRVDAETGERLSYQEIVEKEPWFLYMFLGVGVYVTFVAWTGLWGVESPRNRCCLPFYAHNLVFLLLCTIALTVVVFSENARDFVGGEHVHSLKDITGTTKKMYDTMSENLFATQIMSLVMLFVQLSSLVLTAALRRAVTEYSASAFEDSDDEDGESESLFFGRNKNSKNVGSANFSEKRGDMEQGRGNVVGNADASLNDEDTESWSERMRVKYGVDVSKYAHSPARPPPSHSTGRKKKKYPGTTNPQLAEKANFCGVM